MNSTNRRLSLEEVLDEFFFSAELPTAEMVARACDAYPEYRTDIVEFAALWSSYAALPESTAETHGNVSEASVDRLQSYMLNLVHQHKDVSAPDTDIAAARIALEDLAGEKLRRATEAAGLGRSSLLFQKVLTKQIRNIPRGVLDRLANYLRVARSALEALLGPQLAGSLSYKSSSKPTIPTVESWEEAIRALPVDDEEKARLIALQDEEVI